MDDRRLEQDDDTTRIAYLTRQEAIKLLVESKSDSLALDWNTQDLAAIFGRLRYAPFSEEKAESLAKDFQNTTSEEIAELIKSLKGLVVEAEEMRFQYDNVMTGSDAVSRLKLSDNEFDAAKRLTDLVNNLSNKKKTRGSISERLRDVLKMFANENTDSKRLPASSDIFCPGIEFEDDVNYSRIYKFLAESAIIKKPKSLGPLESAILLNVFDEIQAMADDYFDEHVRFFREFIVDLESLSSKDLAPLEFDDTKIGKQVWNLFNLPDSLVDLSAYVSKRPVTAQNDEDVPMAGEFQF